MWAAIVTPIAGLIIFLFWVTDGRMDRHVEITHAEHEHRHDNIQRYILGLDEDSRELAKELILAKCAANPDLCATRSLEAKD